MNSSIHAYDFSLNIRLTNAFPLSLSFLFILFMVIALAFILLNIFSFFFCVHLLLLALSVTLKNIRIDELDDDKDPLKLVLIRGQFKYIMLVPMISFQIQHLLT